MVSELFEKRCELILDYISQILVYGSDTLGVISLEKNKFDDGKYVIITVSVVKNSYFRWHDLGIKSVDSKKFYEYVFNKTVDKFKAFKLSTGNNYIIIKNEVNNNEIKFSFSLDKKTEHDWFEKAKNKI